MLIKKCRHFDARQRPEAPECLRHSNPAIWPEICRAHTKACKQMLAKNSSREKRNNLVKITPWMTFSHISLSDKNHYKMKINPIVSKKEESSKKARWEPGTLTGVHVNSVYSWPRWRQSTWLFSFPPLNLASGAAVIMAALQQFGLFPYIYDNKYISWLLLWNFCYCYKHCVFKKYYLRVNCPFK